METGLLENWLHRAAFSFSNSPSGVLRSSSPSAQQIAQAWSRVRECVQGGLFLPQHSAALDLLKEYGNTIHVAESQARVLTSILSSITFRPDVEENAAAHARSSAASLLSIWLRRGFAPSGRHGSKASSSRIKETIEAVVGSAIKALESSTLDNGFVSEAILLLGSVCVNPHTPEEQQRVCQEVIARECLRQRKFIGGNNCKEALAGVGYAMVTSSGPTLKALMQALLLLWIDDDALDQKAGVSTARPSLENGLLHLHLMEWYGSFLNSQPKYMASTQIVAEEIKEAFSSSIAISARYGVLLSAAGLLRGLHLHRSTKKPASESAESIRMNAIQTLCNSIVKLVDDTAHLQVQEIATTIKEGTFVDTAIEESRNLISVNQIGDKHWLQCISLAMSRCCRFPSSLSVLVCLMTTLFEDVLPLKAYYDVNMSQPSKEIEDTWTAHTKSILFQEAGAIIRVICEQYESIDGGWQRWAEHFFSQYSHFTYTKHRYYLVLMDSRNQDDLVSPLLHSETGPLKQILEAFLLSAVMFFSHASKKKRDLSVEAKGDFAARVMHSLSCVEFIRQGQVPQYRELVQTCVAWTSASEATCAKIVPMFPSYNEIIQPPGPGVSCYSWKKDVVQDSRVLFGFRVLPTCLQTFTAICFSNEVAPIMFLYMKHPTQALVQSSHSLLVSFFSTKSCEGDRDSIKEQLAVQFVWRTFEDDWALSNYDAFVTVVGAVARHLPAGSTATRECISFLSRKGSENFSLAARRGEEDRLETGEKLQTLLLHLILIVDVQVLPHLLQEVARLVLGQTNPRRIRALEEAFDVLAGSDDLTRKHILVPWLQSLSFLCSNSDDQRRPSPTTSKRRKRRSRSNFSSEVGQEDGAVAFNPSSATMSGANDISQTSRSRL
ncbi:hypothetical protein GOP47_0004130 [Adiantum capillus-veneris]|uniref:Uncharacterized protein n=1 Tax=Adiantum capillus-veneris TaxID=13818 RepID=A0A9D4ZP92_ADICA|nr:hypothetical protein GOP47_0004130 [Adiantum capillus-veneris]